MRYFLTIILASLLACSEPQNNPLGLIQYSTKTSKTFYLPNETTTVIQFADNGIIEVTDYGIKHYNLKYEMLENSRIEITGEGMLAGNYKFTQKDDGILLIMLDEQNELNQLFWFRNLKDPNWNEEFIENLRMLN